VGETYTLVGMDLSWTTVAAYAVVSALMLLIPKVRRNRNLIKLDLSCLVWLVLCLIVNLPISWAFAGLMIIMMSWSLVVSRAKTPRWSMVLGAMAAVGVAGGFIWTMQSIGYERIVLEDTRVSFDQFGRSEEIQRDGLTVHATSGARGWWNTREWQSWTSFGTHDRLGPDIAGFNLYWGPHGLIRGDDLGKRLAEWAHTKPVYRRVASR
jgi:hypothetical protein